MKNMNQTNATSKKTPTLQNRHRPENKDNLDSREGEEQLTKGDDTTHNIKEHQSSRKRIAK